MKNTDYVWILVDCGTFTYDIFKSKDGAMYEALQAIRATYGGTIPEDILDAFCGSSHEDDFFIYLCENPEDVSYFGLSVECREVRD